MGASFRHGNLLGTGIGLCSLNVQLHIDSLQLMADIDKTFLHIQVVNSQPAELGDSHIRIEQNVHRFIAFAVYIVVMYKLQKFTHLVLGDYRSGTFIVYYSPGKLKLKGGLCDDLFSDMQLSPDQEKETDTYLLSDMLFCPATD